MTYTFTKASQLDSPQDWAGRSVAYTYWPDGLVKLLAATLAVVAIAMIVAVALPRQPAAVIAVLALGWIAFRAVGPTFRTTGHSPSVGQLLLAIAASIAAAGAILLAVRPNL